MEGDRRKFELAIQDSEAREAIMAPGVCEVYKDILRTAGATVGAKLSNPQRDFLARVCMLVFSDVRQIRGLVPGSDEALKLVEVSRFPPPPKPGMRVPGFKSFKTLNEVAKRLRDFDADVVFGPEAFIAIGAIAEEEEDVMYVRRCRLSSSKDIPRVTIGAMSLATGGRAVVDFTKIFNAFKAYCAESLANPLVVDLVIFVLNTLLSMFLSNNIPGILFKFVADGGEIIPKAAYHCIHRLRKFFGPMEKKCRLSSKLIEVLEGRCEFRNDGSLLNHYPVGNSYPVSGIRGVEAIKYEKADGINEDGVIDVFHIGVRDAWLATKYYIMFAWTTLKSLPLWRGVNKDFQTLAHFGVEQLFGIFVLADPEPKVPKAPKVPQTCQEEVIRFQRAPQLSSESVLRFQSPLKELKVLSMETPSGTVVSEFRSPSQGGSGILRNPNYPPLSTFYYGNRGMTDFYELWRNRDAYFFTEEYFSRLLFMQYIYENASYRHLPSQWRLVTVAEGVVVIETGETHNEETDEKLRKACIRQELEHDHAVYRLYFDIRMSPWEVLNKLCGGHVVGGAQSNGANG